ncbi:MAG: hypothetical protein ACXWAB_03985 [Methylobacter sp.]
MFEKKHEKLAPLSIFVRRMVLSVGMAGILMTLVENGFQYSPLLSAEFSNHKIYICNTINISVELYDYQNSNKQEHELGPGLVM